MDSTPKLQSSERNTDGRPVNLPGVYVHKPTGREVITSGDDFGVVQADALMSPVWKGEWERVGDVPSGTELLERRKAQEVKDATETALEEGKHSAELKEAVKAAKERAAAL